MSEEEIIDILQNIICDEVIGTYCIKIQEETDCSENCKDDDCYLIKAVDGIIDLYNKEKEKNKTLEIELEIKKYCKVNELTSDLIYYKNLARVYQGNSVSKDKIKARIEEYQNKIEKIRNKKTINEPEDTIIITRYAHYISCLQSLLENKE